MANKTQERIREEAYMMWESEGRQEGREMDYWLAAEQKVLSPKSKTKKSAVAVVKTTKKKAPAKKKTTAKKKTAAKK